VGDLNRDVIEEFRANGGRVGGALAGTPLMLLHTVGARSGTPRVTPVAYTALDNARFAIVGTNGGSPVQPAWCHNLRANPTVTVEVGNDMFTARVHEPGGTERDDLWHGLVARHPDIGKHQAATSRPIPLFVLTRLP